VPPGIIADVANHKPQSQTPSGYLFFWDLALPLPWASGYTGFLQKQSRIWVWVADPKLNFRFVAYLHQTRLVIERSSNQFPLECYSPFSAIVPQPPRTVNHSLRARVLIMCVAPLKQTFSKIASLTEAISLDHQGYICGHPRRWTVAVLSVRHPSPNQIFFVRTHVSVLNIAACYEQQYEPDSNYALKLHIDIIS